MLLLPQIFLGCVAILAGLQELHCLKKEYLWRDYDDVIPEDAIVGGKNADGDNIYIGQVNLEGQGSLVAEISPGFKTEVVNDEQITETDSSVKILSGNQQGFTWIPVNSDNLHISLIGKHAIIGGRENNLGYLNVGRTSYENSVKIGKITSYSMDHARLYFVHNGTILSTKLFQVLVYLR